MRRYGHDPTTSTSTLRRRMRALVNSKSVCYDIKHHPA
jgi:hypothetical protein